MIREDILKKYNCSLDTFLYLVSILHNINIEEAAVESLEKGYITAKYTPEMVKDGFRVTNKGIEIINNIIIDSDNKIPKTESLKELAVELKAIFPKGKKDGTNLYWAEGVALIEKRLQIFFKKYGTYPYEDIIHAAKCYVEGYNSYQYMQVLKYFIFKEKIGVGGEVEPESQLINYMENKGQEEVLREDWTSNIM